MFLQLENDHAFLLIMASDKDNLIFTNKLSNAINGALNDASFSNIFILVDENTFL